MYRIVNIGIDIVEIDRIKKILERRPRFVERFFDSEEIEQIRKRNNFEKHLAGRFAAKEAIVKAMGTGFEGIPFREIKVLNDERGKPIVKLDGKAAEKCRQCGIEEFALSISFTRNTAAASAVALAVNGRDD